MVKGDAMKKIISVFSVVMLLCLSVLPASAADEPEIYGKFSGAAKEGGKATYTLYIKNNPGIASCRLNVNFNTKVLKPVMSDDESLAVTNRTGTGGVTGNTTDDGVVLLWYTDKNYTEDGALCSFDVDVAKAENAGKYTFKIEKVDDPIQENGKAVEDTVYKSVKLTVKHDYEKGVCTVCGKKESEEKKDSDDSTDESTAANQSQSQSGAQNNNAAGNSSQSASKSSNAGNTTTAGNGGYDNVPNTGESFAPYIMLAAGFLGIALCLGLKQRISGRR